MANNVYDDLPTGDTASATLTPPPKNLYDSIPTEPTLKLDGSDLKLPALPPDPFSPVPNARPVIPDKPITGTLNMAGNVGKGAVADIGALLGTTAAGAPSESLRQGGNIAAALLNQPMPVDAMLKDVAQKHPVIATGGKIAAGVGEAAPYLALGGLPEGAAKLAALGFSAQMIKGAGDSATKLGNELGKNPEDRDNDVITSAVADLSQTALFAPLAAKYGATDFVEGKVRPNDLVVRKLAEQLKTAPAIGPVAANVKPPTTGAPNAKIGENQPDEARTFGQQEQIGDPNAPQLRTGDEPRVQVSNAPLRQPQEPRVEPLSPHDLQPSVRAGDKVVVGDSADAKGHSHDLIFHHNFKEASTDATPEEKAKRVNEILDFRDDEKSHGFTPLDENGKPKLDSNGKPVFLSRDEAGAALGKNKPLTSEDLVALKKMRPKPVATKVVPLTGKESPEQIIKRVSDMSGDDFLKSFSKGGYNHINLPLGDKMRSPEGIATLTKAWEKSKSEMEQAKEEHEKTQTDESLKQYVDISTKPQFFKEALDIATGKEKFPAAQEIKPETKPSKSETVEPQFEGSIPLDVHGSPMPIGPGAATRRGGNESEFGEPGTFSRDVTGLREKTRKQREAAGQTEPTQPGQGIAPEASVERGRQLLKSGADPEKVMSDFEKSNRASSDDFAVVRAHQEQLARETNQAEEQFGTNSPEFQRAYIEESKWAKRTKAMQTEWAKAGHAQQGEVDIDTGTFSGLKRAYRDAHEGKELPAKDEKQAKDLAEQNRKAKQEQKDLLNKVGEEIDKLPPAKQSPVEKAATDAEKKAIAAAHKTVREAAARLAAAESKIRAVDASRDNDLKNIQDKAVENALKASTEIRRKAINQAAKTESEARTKKAIKDKSLAEVQASAARKALEAANKTVREAAARAAELENKKRIAEAGKKQVPGTLEHTKTEFFRYKGGKMDNDQVKAMWAYAKKAYIDKGNSNFSDIVRKLATDLGIPFKDVANGLAQPKGVRKVTNELWRKQTDARRVSEAAKRWVRQKNSPVLGQVVPRIARVMFGAKVFGHGFVAFGTHAPMVAFMPHHWKTYFSDFGKIYKMVFSQAEYEINVQHLRSDANFTTAQRAGLVNDPYQVEDFNNPDMAQYFGRLSGAGNRGYFALKILRQDLFNKQWDKLPATLQTPEMASAMADDINHITGVVKSSMGNKASLALFAPRLLLSRAAFLAGDPYKAIEATTTAMSPSKWAALAPEKKWQILNQVKQKATIVATAYALLEANKYLLQSIGSKQQVNTTDPTKSDFMKFKAAGMDFSWGNAMLNMARLPLRMWTIGAGDGGKLKHVIYPDESMYSAAGEFIRSQASPMATVGLDLIFKGDYQNRPLPQIPGYGKPIPMPKRLAAQGIKPYTWTEYAAEQVSPIPLEEAEKEVWRHGLGDSPEQLKAYAKALGTLMVMTGTGGRLTEDTQLKK